MRLFLTRLLRVFSSNVRLRQEGGRVHRSLRTGPGCAGAASHQRSSRSAGLLGSPSVQELGAGKQSRVKPVWSFCLLWCIVVGSDLKEWKIQKAEWRPWGHLSPVCWPGESVCLGMHQTAVSFSLSVPVRLCCSEGDGLAVSVSRTRNCQQEGGGVGWGSIFPLPASPGYQVHPQRTAAPARRVPLQKGLHLGTPGARPSSLASASSLLPSPFLASSSLGIRVLLKPLFYCFSGVLAGIGRRCSCSNHCLYSEVSITLIS